MLYIKKEGLCAELEQKIIEIRKSDIWNNIDQKDTKSIRNIFDNVFPKDNVKEILIREQKGICAYCMKRIRMDSHSRVEHWIPLSANKESAIDYNNLFGVCDGGEKIIAQEGHIVCCDANKKEMAITTNPLNEVQMKKIAYKPDGTIYTQPEDKVMEKDINEILLLNGIRKADGSVRDTSTEILKGRRDAYDRARQMMDNLNRRGKCTSISVKKIIDNLQNKEELEEFVGVKLYYFYKKYNALVRRGL